MQLIAILHGKAQLMIFAFITTESFFENHDVFMSNFETLKSQLCQKEAFMKVWHNSILIVLEVPKLGFYFG